MEFASGAEEIGNPMDGPPHRSGTCPIIGIPIPCVRRSQKSFSPYARPDKRIKLSATLTLSRQQEERISGISTPTNLKPATAQLSGGERPYFDPIETAPRSELRKLQEERLLQQFGLRR